MIGQKEKNYLVVTRPASPAVAIVEFWVLAEAMHAGDNEMRAAAYRIGAVDDLRKLEGRDRELAKWAIEKGALWVERKVEL